MNKRPNAKLKPEDIPTIRRRIREGYHGILSHLAREYGVSHTTMRDLRDGVTWASVPE